MKRKFGLLFIGIFALSGCERIEQWRAQDEQPTIHMELTEEQLELFDPNDHSDFNGTIEITIVEDSEDEIAEEEESVEVADEERQELIDALPEEVHSKDWNLILVNNWHPLPEDFEVELEEVENEQRIDARIVEAWNEWREAANEAGHALFFASGYRSVEHQEQNYNNRIQGYIEEGYSEEEAQDLTEDYIAIPGHSEHHTGLALDIVDQEWIAEGNGLEPEYDTQESQHWLVETMADYGFILRYPEGKEEITDIQYESWHFRYVGVENAQFIVEHDLVLEEYIELLEERETFETEESEEESEEQQPEEEYENDPTESPEGETQPVEPPEDE